MDTQTPNTIEPNLKIETPLKDLQNKVETIIESPEEIEAKKEGKRNIRFSVLGGFIILILITVLFIFVPWPECGWFESRSANPKIKSANCPKSISIWQLIQFNINERSAK